MSDEHGYDDAAYVLGALSPSERDEFERHLSSCAECRARVAEIADLPRALATVPDPAALVEAPPQTLLPGLLRRVAARRSRQRWLTGGLTALVAACVTALVIAVWPSGGTGGPPETRHFTALVHQPVAATAALTSKRWGTEIDLTCVYRSSRPEPRIKYWMYVYPRFGERIGAGGWWQPGGKDVKFVTGTPLTAAQIAKIEITLPDGTPILRLTN